ncbi:serine/threonine protein kinase [Saprospiraceae bacterium]|nr:serine/threonine protein kinase [Saprospiraceae bacterium]
MKQPDYQRVRELFQKAVTLSGLDRTKYLDEACADDPVHRQAVEELLQHHSTEPLLMAEHEPPKASANWETANQLKSPTLVESRNKQKLVSRLTKQFRTERRLVWLMAPLAAILLAVLAVWVQRATHEAVRSSMQEKIQAMLEQQVFALSQVLRTETELVKSWARSPEFCIEVAKLAEEAEKAKDPNDQLTSSPAKLQLRHIIRQLSGQEKNVQYSVWSRDGMLIANSGEQSSCLGNLLTPYGGSILSRAFAGEVVLSLLTTERHITKGLVPPPVEKKPKLAIFVPVYAVGDSSRTIACLSVFDSGSQNRFEDLFQAAQFGESAEFYAIDRRGYLITESRFPDQLRDTGLIGDDPNSFTGSVVRVADPGGDITAGFQPEGELLEMPLTHAAASAVAGHSGQNYEGFNDYRGVEVVGAWEWLDDFGFGVIGQMDRSEAFESLRPLQQAYGLLIALLGLSLLGWIAASMALVRARQAAGIAAQIGPYKIDKKIGEGGLGQVFLATHTLLKRPTALKLLKPEEVNAKNERRFEREIHIASSLMHRNTIEIYDYGKTRDGGFYSAMEYIDGLTLNQMVDLDGPQRPERVVRILGEVCGSLKEAHARGLIHRDIKPQNIMLCCQGGESDSVKVLDFGLARDIEQNQWRVTDTQMLVGTPMYIAPERIVDSTCIDPRSDIFSLGVVAYFMLTGQEPFDAKDAIEALSSTLQQEPPSVSENSPWSIPGKLELLVNQCQAKKIEDRVNSIEDLLHLLAEVRCEQQWTSENASRWWWQHAPEMAERSAVSRVED